MSLEYDFALMCPDVIAHNARFNGNRTAVVCEDERLTWRELDERTNRVANALKAEGLGKGDKVALYMSTSMAAFVAFWGSAKAGCVTVPLNVLLDEESLARLATDSDAALVIADPTTEPRLDRIRDRLRGIRPRGFVTLGGTHDQWRSLDDLLSAVPATPCGVKILPDDIITILYTSGTTGDPKGIEHTHVSRMMYPYGFSMGLKIDRYSVAVLGTPPYASGTWITMIPTMYRGGTVVILPKFTAEAFLSAVQREKGTHAFLVPTQDSAAIAECITRLLACRVAEAEEITLSRPVRVFGGNARLAWSCEASWVEGGAPRKEPLILLVRGAGSQVTTDPAWEVAVLERVVPQGVRAPTVWAHDLGGELLGGPAVLLERLPGRADPVAWLTGEPEVGRARTLDLAWALAELHRADPSGLPASDPLVDLWRDRFLASRLEPLPALSWLFDWLTDHETEPERATIVHGDFRPGNVLYEDDRITALLDWELAHLGDPVEDLAWAYRAFWSPERFVPLPEFVATYESAAGVQVGANRLLWHRVFCEVKFATISLQAARSVVDGRSHNLRLIDRARTVAPALAQSLDWIVKGEPC